MSLNLPNLDAVFLDTLDELAALGDNGDVHRALVSVTHRYGLKNAAYLAYGIRGYTHQEPLISVTYSNEWIKRYSDLSYMRQDPVITRGLASIMPLEWNDLDLTQGRIKKFFGEARDFGVGRHGMTFPIRGRHGEQALFSITSDENDIEWSRIRRLFMRDFQTIAYHIHQLVLRAEGITAPNVRLSPREVDVLRWASLGKTAIETALILGIGERTSRFYLETARHKLGAVSITHAVAKAIALNIISIHL
ncbi:MAG: LuxR family transcriptional regulator [Janthinobacterium lividum]